MANQDLTTFTEVDTGDDRLTVTASRATFTGVVLTEDVYDYYDFGANYFDGNFKHYLTCYITDSSEAAGFPMSHAWVLANIVGTWQDMIDAADDGLGIRLLWHGGNSQYQVNAQELDAGNAYNDIYVADKGVIYYCTAVRNENVGTYGTFYILLFSDATRTTLLDVLSIALHTSKKDYRYYYAFQSRGQAYGTAYISGYSENHNIGWTNIGKIDGIDVVTINKLDGVYLIDIAKINGVAV